MIDHKLKRERIAASKPPFVSQTAEPEALFAMVRQRHKAS